MALNNIITVPRDPDVPVRVRRFMQEVADCINSIARNGQLPKTGIGTYSITIPLAASSGLEYSGGALRIDLNTTILNLSPAGLGFSSQACNTILAGPDNAAGTPTFRALVANDVAFLAGVYQPLDADLSCLANASYANGIPYRIADGDWSNVTIGANMTFANGVLNSIVPASGVTTFNGCAGAITLANGSNITLTDFGNGTFEISASGGGGGGGSIGFGNFASRPAASAGSMYVANDSPAPVSIANASAWFSVRDGSIPLEEPSNTTFNIVIDANASVTHLQKNGYVELYHSGPTNGSDRHNHGRACATAGSFTIDLAFEMVRNPSAAPTAAASTLGGLIFRDSGNGTMITAARYIAANWTDLLIVDGWSSNTTPTGNIFASQQFSHGDKVLHFRGVWNGTTLTLTWSPDGVRYYTYYTHTPGGGFVPDQAGYYLENFGAQRDMALNVWRAKIT